MEIIQKHPLASFVLLCIMVVATIVSGTMWSIADIQLDQAKIAGNAYRDYGTIQAYDGLDPALPGLTIQLYKVGEEIPIQETKTDERGRYEFTVVEPGIYFVQAPYGIEGYPFWDYIVTLRHSGNILVEEAGQSYDGSIFLAGEYPVGGYGGKG